METPEIVSHLAQLIRQRGVWEKDPGKQSRVREQPAVPDRDAVQLTQAGAHYAASGSEETDLEQEQAMKVQRLKALVENGNYHLNDEMVEDIASSIAKMFV
jgi:anti-sigma28 factor (negative regulator of flagellin synthesis)